MTGLCKEMGIENSNLELLMGHSRDDVSASLLCVNIALARSWKRFSG